MIAMNIRGHLFVVNINVVEVATSWVGGIRHAQVEQAFRPGYFHFDC